MVCGERIDFLKDHFWVSDKGMVHEECRPENEEMPNMVNCGACHKPIKITRDKHYFDDQTRKRYHLGCIIDVCPGCDKPILTEQQHKKTRGQEYHIGCVPEKRLFSRKNGIKTVDEVSWKAMEAARKANKVAKKDWRRFEEWFFEQFPPTYEEDAQENPIGITSAEDFLKWWSQGVSLGLIRVDGNVVDGPDLGRWTDWWSHGLLLGIVSTKPDLHLESGENIIDYIVRSLTLGFISTGGKPTILQKEANDMAKQGIIPKITLPRLPEMPTISRTNPAEVWIDEDELTENPLPLIPLAIMAAPYVTDAYDKAVKASGPAPASSRPPLPPKQPAHRPVYLRPNPNKVHYILATKEGKVYANKWGTKNQAEDEAHDIYKRSGMTVGIIYPSEKSMSAARQVGSIIKGT
jgi:hypothetical protein